MNFSGRDDSSDHIETTQCTLSACLICVIRRFLRDGNDRNGHMKTRLKHPLKYAQQPLDGSTPFPLIPAATMLCYFLVPLSYIISCINMNFNFVGFKVFG